jgi:alpha-beta hydrolase superfamily lysophospholipase
MVANVPLGFARRVFTRLLFPSPAGYPRRVRNDERILGLRATDGAIVHAVEVVGAAVPDTAPVLLFFHGNADTAFADVPLARSFAERGVRTFALEYRGYGLSRHVARPSEAGLYADADALLAHVQARFPMAPLVLWGRSLGTGCAVELATRTRPLALVLISPYTSMHDMAQRFVRSSWAPTLATAHFDNIGKAPKISCPTLVVHGDSDRLIPLSMGRKLASQLQRAELMVVAGGHHNDLFAKQGDTIVERAFRLVSAPGAGTAFEHAR